MNHPYSRVLGTGSYLPEQLVSNHDLEQRVDTNHDWIVERTGIHQRHIARAGETTCDLAEQAAKSALEAAGVSLSSIDMILVATTTPDRIFPSTACLLQARLGRSLCPAFDVQAVCTGFIYCLSIADQFIRQGSAKRVLVVGAETLSRIVDWNDRTTCVLFGDGAGAVVLGADTEPGILSTHIHADGQYQDLLTVPNGVSQGLTTNPDAMYIQMQGNKVFKVAVKTLGRLVTDTLHANNMEQDDIDWLIPHQANIRIIKATADKLGMPMSQVVTTLAEQGNTSAASIPLALDTAVRDGRVQRGQTVLLEAFGGGFTWGSALLRY